MEFLISFIIPAHNSSQTLKRAVESIEEGLSSPELCEVIIVENGSTDNTVEIANQLVESYANVQLYQSDKGVSKARNFGLNHARGKFVSFLDSDDYLLPDSTQLLLDELDNCKHEIIFLGYEKNGKSVDLSKFNSLLDTDKVEFLTQILINPTLYMTVWAKVFDIEYLKRNNIFFDEELIRSEDAVFLFEGLLNTDKIGISSILFYHYSIDNDSTTRGRYLSIKDDYVSALDKASEIYNKSQHNNLEIGYNGFVLSHLKIIMVRDIFSIYRAVPYRQKLKEMKELVNSPVFSSSLKNFPFFRTFRVYYLPELFHKIKMDSISALIYLTKSYMNKKNETRGRKND